MTSPEIPFKSSDFLSLFLFDCFHLLLLLFIFSSFIYLFILLLYNIVLVLPYIDMHPPWVHMCFPF